MHTLYSITHATTTKRVREPLYGSNMANRVVDRVMQIHGGMGYTREMPIERWYRDLLKGYVKIGAWE